MQLNIDAKETEKFSKMAEQWWDKNGPCKPLHIINSARLEYIKNTTEICGKKILDVGCGGGILTESLFDLGAVVTGIDATSDIIKTAKLHAKEHHKKIEYFHISSEEFAQNNPEKFDIITCMELLEHIPDPISLINSLVSMIKPGGKVFFSTINRNLKSYLLGIVAAEYILKLLPKDTHEYEKFITPAELATWLRKTGLQLQEVKGIFFNPITNQATLNNDLSVNYIAYAIKP